MKDFLNKNHTLIVAIVAALCAGAQVVLGFPIPDYVYSLLAALGITSVRVTYFQAQGVGGWKTYALAGGEAILAGLRASGVDVPVEVDAILVSLAGGTMASAIKKSS